MAFPVVPPVLNTLENCLKEMDKYINGNWTRSSYWFINKSGAKETGADRIVNAVAAAHLYGGDLVIIDFGTATTFVLLMPTENIWGINCSRNWNFQEALYENCPFTSN